MAGKKRTMVWGIVAVVSTACATVAVRTSAPEPVEAMRAEVPAPAVPPPPIEPPPPGFDVERVPDIGVAHPDFPYLPGERRDVSRSIGDVSNGWLANGVTIPTPHPYMAFLPVQFTRRLLYTSDEMLALVEGAAAYVWQQHEGTPTYLGNFGAPGGGDIPYSVSHNSGRDSDVAFFHVDADGNPAVVPDLLPLDDLGEWRDEESGAYYKFDTPRNWTFVAGLLRQETHNLQYIFISTPLRRMLLDHARSVGADPSLIAQAETVLTQPGGALPHNDHFHLRIYCSEKDLRSGCEDTGRRHGVYVNRTFARSEAIRAAQAELASSENARRVAAVRRLEVMDAGNAARDIAPLIADEDPLVRAAAARALGSLGGRAEIKALGGRLDVEEDHQVRVELIDALARSGGTDAAVVLAKLLDAPQSVTLPGEVVVDARTIVADALIKLEDPRPVERLIGILNSTDLQVSSRARNALRLLTNHDFPVEGEAVRPAWEEWHQKWGRRGRDAWLIEGFNAAGFPVKRLSLSNVWELCRAIEGPDHVSYNAQRTLMRLASREVPSTEWSKADAYFYWRRWFERRCARLGCPAVPPEMSTLKPGE